MCGFPANRLEQVVEQLRDKHDVTISAVPKGGRERQEYSMPSIDHEAEQHINAQEAEFGADGTRVFRETEAAAAPTIRELHEQYKPIVLAAVMADVPYTQFKRLWQYIVTRTVKERFYYRYEDGKRVKHTVTPVLGEKAAHNGKVIYSLDFEVTPHQLRHTYITNLIHSSVDPKTVQYLAGHESSKITMDIYAKVKYNRPDELVRTMGGAFAQWDAAQA